LQAAHPFEQSIGMEFYCTEGPGIGGSLRNRFEDFLVEEIGPSGEVMEYGDWPTGPPIGDREPIGGVPSKYVRFTAQKMGLSTLDLATILAAAVKVPRYLVGYAGLKDKRAVTVQAMSLPTLAFKSLEKARLSRIAVRSPQYTRRPVNVGDLWGNRFTVLLRGAEADCDAALNLVNSVEKQPILNYFGIQRFGVTRPLTHLIGKSLAKKNYEEAVRLMLSRADSENQTASAKEEVEGLEGQSSEEITPRQSSRVVKYEKVAAEHLAKHPGDYLGALAKVSPRILTIMVHSYQSYLFNRLISLRAKSGLSIHEPEPGDFLIQLDMTHSGRDSWLYVTDRKIDECRALVDSGSYGLAAPVPGYSTKAPPSKQTDLLKEILRDENLELREFRNTTSRSLDSPGGLHLVSIAPIDMHADCTDEVLTIRFSLRKGSYATVVLREIMKTDPVSLI
jgi:tRNA pseudouridine13 synthase